MVGSFWPASFFGKKSEALSRAPSPHRDADHVLAINLRREVLRDRIRLGLGWC
jgi:hypothetical protein